MHWAGWGRISSCGGESLLHTNLHLLAAWLTSKFREGWLGEGHLDSLRPRPHAGRLLWPRRGRRLRTYLSRRMRRGRGWGKARGGGAQVGAGRFALRGGSSPPVGCAYGGEWARAAVTEDPPSRPPAVQPGAQELSAVMTQKGGRLPPALKAGHAEVPTLMWGAARSLERGFSKPLGRPQSEPHRESLKRGDEVLPSNSSAPQVCLFGEHSAATRAGGGEKRRFPLGDRGGRSGLSPAAWEAQEDPAPSLKAPPAPRALSGRPSRSSTWDTPTAKARSRT